MIVESLLQSINQGRKGRNQGITTGIPKLDSITDGVCRETSTLIFSNSGSGKSSMCLYCYMYHPLTLHLDDDKYKVLYFSLEMKAEFLLAKLLSTHIFFTYGIEISFKELLSKSKDYILDDEKYRIVQECIPWLKKVEKHITIYDKMVNADTIYAITMEWLNKFGTFNETKNRTLFNANDPEQTLVAIVDHVGLLTTKNGRSLKEEIDLTSKFAVSLRNRTSMSWVFVQQANRDQGNIERFKAGKSAFTLNDPKDSGNLVQDVEVVLAIYNPFRDGLKTYQKYDVATIGRNFRSIMCLKNRYGESEIEIGTNFFGKVNVWKELPKPEEINDYEKYTTSDWILGKEIEKKVDTVKTTSKYVF